MTKLWMIYGFEDFKMSTTLGTVTLPWDVTPATPALTYKFMMPARKLQPTGLMQGRKSDILGLLLSRRS